MGCVSEPRRNRGRFQLVADFRPPEPGLTVSAELVAHTAKSVRRDLHTDSAVPPAQGYTKRRVVLRLAFAQRQGNSAKDPMMSLGFQAPHGR